MNQVRVRVNKAAAPAYEPYVMTKQTVSFHCKYFSYFISVISINFLNESIKFNKMMIMKF